MTDRNQFEAMLEALINEDQETAKEIFHNIVVAKSREIYEELLSEDFDLEESEDTGNPYAKKDDEESTDEAADDEADDAEEPADDEADADDEEPADDVGGDATDDFVSDVSDEEGEEDMSDEEQVDRIMDLEDALEELKAEFEQLMAGEDGDMGADDMGAEPEMDGGMDAMGAEPEMGGEDELAKMMEYVDKVALPKHGDNGANTRSIVAKKNDMGGTTANIVKGGESKGEGTKGGLLNPSTKEENFGNVNVPGGKGATKLSSVSKGHGAEKKGTGEQADNKKSTIGSR